MTELTDRDIALRVATRALGGDRLKALELLFSDPSAVDPDTIAAEQSKLAADKRARAQAEHEASPDGLREKAMQLQEQRAKRKTDALLAEALLIEQGYHPERDLASLTPDEKIELAGLAEKPAEETVVEKTMEQRVLEHDLNRWWNEDVWGRKQIATDHGLDYDEVAAEMQARADNGQIYS